MKNSSPTIRLVVSVLVYAALGQIGLVQASSRIAQVYRDSIDYYKAPLSWQSKHWRRFGLITGAVVIASVGDEKLRSAVLRHRSTDRQRLANVGRAWPERYGPLLGVVLLAGPVYGKPGWQDRGFNMLESAALALFSTSIIKWSALRCRPNFSANSNKWLHRGCGRSFPSGHTTIAFALSTALVKSLPRADWRLQLPAYALALNAAYSRIYDNKHWLSDVIAGAAIGYYSADFIVSARRRKIPPTQLWLGSRSIGLGWSW